MNYGSYITQAADLIALLVKAPRSISELAELAQVTPGTASRWINALVAEGLLEADGTRKSSRGLPARVWRWAPR